MSSAKTDRSKFVLHQLVGKSEKIKENELRSDYILSQLYSIVLSKGGFFEREKERGRERTNGMGAWEENIPMNEYYQ